MSALLGVLSAFDTPLRQSLLSNFVGDRGDLPNALALNATLYTCSRFVDPQLAGLLLEYTSESVCFSLHALSYLALVATFLRAWTEPTARVSGSMGAVFREGLEYVFHAPNVRRLILGCYLSTSLHRATQRCYLSLQKMSFPEIRKRLACFGGQLGSAL